MVAFATVFLLKICKHFRGSLYYDVDQIYELLEELVALLTKAALDVHPGHWLVGLTGGIKMLLNHVFPTTQVLDGTGCSDAVTAASEQPGQSADGVAEGMGDEEWLEGIWNGGDMRDFDLLGADLMMADVFQAQGRQS